MKQTTFKHTILYTYRAKFDKRKQSIKRVRVKVNDLVNLFAGDDSPG